MARPHRTGPAPARRSNAVPVAAALASAALTLLLGSGYAVGRTVVAAEPEGHEEQVPVAAWTGTGGVLHADDATAAQLRAEGWTLPTLAADGYRVASMTRGTLAGRPVVTIALHHGEDSVVVVEQRGRVDPDNPMDGLTGLPVSAEGLEPSAVAGVPLWVDAGPPWRAVLAGEGVVYTVAADTSPATMAHTVNLVVADERGRVVAPAAGDPGVVPTVLAGLREIFD
ncbi:MULTISPECIES: hypothetical protein [Kocuria]|jgi:hypothetical protein|uniref:hypothetical protein n=1 Tax=Kocuria TaxID=57493 RepID=UPI00203C0AD0|nr:MULTISPECIES: hypothetical protein [Kocuria]MCM3688786.1 hypothetical protein [Kocuria rosea]HST73458.1 hypothetical protein [Kocuria rosea]